MSGQVRTIEIPVSRGNRLQKTVELIGSGIVNAATYQPLRLHAAQLASRAPHKDYVSQLREIYNDFLGRWRYVRDPYDLETVATSGPAVWGLIAGSFNDDPRGHGHGDCDDATVYLGAAARAIGLPVRIVTMTKRGRSKKEHSHVYPEVHVPEVGWIAMDPVAHPQPMGFRPPATHKTYWGVDGREFPSNLGDLGRIQPVLISPSLWKPRKKIKLVRGKLILPVGWKEYIKRAAVEYQRAVEKKKKKPAAPATGIPSPKPPREKRAFFVPKDVTTAIVRTPEGERTQLPPISLPQSVITAAAQGATFKMFRYGGSGPAGWLGNLLGYALTIRTLSFRWLLWKRQAHPWDRTMSDGTKTDIYWMKKRVEPPPLVAHSWPEAAPGGLMWTAPGWLEPGDKPFEVLQRLLTMNYDIFQQATGKKSGTWNWSKHPEWGFYTKENRPSWLRQMFKKADLTVKVPKWYPDSEEHYMTRLRAYYANGAALVWSAAIYAIHARRQGKIPAWFQRHCCFWGIPFPSQQLRKERRYFTDSTRFGPRVEPVSINGVGKGLSMSQDDLEELLALVVHHTPVPGTVDPIPHAKNTLLCDMPPAIGPMRPIDSLNVPLGFARGSWARKEKQLNEGWQGELSGAIQTIVNSTMSMVASGAGQTITTAVKGMVAGAVGEVLAKVVSGAISMCAQGALNFAETGQVKMDIWKNIVSIAVGTAREQTIGSVREELQGQISNIEDNLGYSHLQDMWGGGLEEEAGTIYESLNSDGKDAMNRLRRQLWI